jgi:hypothetical protein
MPTDLMVRFSRKKWKDCCGKGCKKCEIAQTYIGEYGKKKGLELLNEDRAAAKKGKAPKKVAKADGKKHKGGAKKGAKKVGGKGKKTAKT